MNHGMAQSHPLHQPSTRGRCTNQALPRGVALAPRPILQPCRGRPAPVPYAAGCALVCVVAVVVGTIFVLGASLILPAVSSPAALAVCHLPMAVWLVFNIC